MLASCKSSDSAQNDSSQIKSSAANFTYPKPDADLGEAYHDGELEAAKALPDLIQKQILARYVGGKRVLRDAHPKSHGCLNAEFVVNPNIDPNFAQGVFSEGSRYKAIVRYSNANADPAQPDIKGDGRGMAVKLLGVKGPKLTDAASEVMTQDLIMINHPVFFIADPQLYVKAVEKAGSRNIFSKISLLTTLGIKGSKIALAIQGKQIASPIQSAYFSEVPYQLGLGSAKKAVRYKVEPCSMNGSETVPNGTEDNNYLRHRLITHFKSQDACFTVFAQQKTNASMNVEDSRDEWDSPWVSLATLTMKGKEQNLADSPGEEDPRNVACDTLSFNPWHSLAEHKPLGAMNRMRRAIYEQISKVRHAANGETRKEP